MVDAIDSEVRSRVIDIDEIPVRLGNDRTIVKEGVSIRADVSSEATESSSSKRRHSHASVTSASRRPSLGSERSLNTLSSKSNQSTASKASRGSLMTSIMRRIRTLELDTAYVSSSVMGAEKMDDSERSECKAHHSSEHSPCSVPIAALVATFASIVSFVSCACGSMVVFSKFGVEPLSTMLVPSLWISLAMAAVGVVVGFLFGLHISCGLRSLDNLASCISCRTREAPLAIAPVGRRIREISQMHERLEHLSYGVQTFSRYLPSTVVSSILSGDERASRLHVTSREVTIMFTDIRDFTAMSESMHQKDLIFVLTRYFSVMTRIVESYGGVVAEILGDGLLAYWNTPDDVEDHAQKGCCAALAQLQVLEHLNAEMSKFQLPALNIRVGLNTGYVLTGNLGSEAKMKFGCLGDPVNLASRLESLCKYYGVSIVCSGATVNSIQSSSSFFFRQLDLVQVKGKHKPTRLYELIALVEELEENECLQSVVEGAVSASDLALSRFEGLDFNPFHFRLKLNRSRSFEAAHEEAKSPNPQQPRRGTSGLLTFEIIREVTPQVREFVSLYEAALKAYQKADFASARTNAEAALSLRPQDVALGLLMERISTFEGGIFGEDLQAWTGVRVMTEK
eukprot:TRINITY_DN64579_c0_g1_i1.p1 TRINITY_DN64579_c0_g1~~TRINITY_DN64579_c0_g1_i1.p1  ORF type:complete len:625 (-),score=52.47 TRINITY_DN64579_c0_g1_i1:311-2185(-)